MRHPHINQNESTLTGVSSNCSKTWRMLVSLRLLRHANTIIAIKFCKPLPKFEICHVLDGGRCVSASAVCATSLIPRHLHTFLSSTVEHMKERKCRHQNGTARKFFCWKGTKTTCLPTDDMPILPPAVHVSGVIRKW